VARESTQTRTQGWTVWRSNHRKPGAANQIIWPWGGSLGGGEYEGHRPAPGRPFKIVGMEMVYYVAQASVSVTIGCSIWRETISSSSPDNRVFTISTSAGTLGAFRNVAVAGAADPVFENPDDAIIGLGLTGSGSPVTLQGINIRVRWRYLP